MAGELTPAQRAYVRKRTKEDHTDPSELAGELNIIPFLDIVVNLIMFLLVTTLTVVAVVQIETQLPSYKGGKGGSGVVEESLNLNITITENGVIVTGSGGKLAPGCSTTATGRVLTVPKKGNDYDWAGLTKCVATVKAEFPDERQVIVGADPTVEFEHLVKAMDAVRNKGPGTDELFPDVLLSGGVR